MNQDKVKNVMGVLDFLFDGKMPIQFDLSQYIQKIIEIYRAKHSDEISLEEIDEAVRQYQIKKGIKMDTASILVECQDDKWFDKFDSNDFEHYNRYLKYLKNEKHISQEVINKTRENNFLTLRNFADPSTNDDLQRKGLVVGDVQAGKTMNYIGLINLAVDVGYKNFILLTGNTEELRKQTQRRVDEGFVGYYSESLEKDVRDYCGVGTSECDHFAVPMTSYEHDFSTTIRRGLNYKLSELNLPKIFVVKKNARVLNQVEQMINRDNLSTDSVLIIDDECDFASVNTKDDENPTVINKAIRSLMNTYARATYVGYSATPFANIFVNPDAVYEDDDEKVPDLFPSDFIVLLESPDNYIGAKDMFLGFDDTLDIDEAVQHSGKFAPYVHLIGNRYDDEGNEIIDNNFLSVTHKKDCKCTELADSLKKAIKVFLLSSCVYTLRGYDKEHRTMLINISRFNDVQDDIGYRVKEYVKDLKNSIGSAIKMSAYYFNKQEMLSDLQSIWEKDIAFSRGSSTRENPPNQEFGFDSLKKVMKDEIDSMEVFIINRKHIKDRLDYNKYEGKGTRAIVVGGFTLSRGLTLVGLMTSYYNRNATAYDTMVQMGRWFGYRDGYDDLINIYMTQSSIDAFCAATDATEDLKVQFREMAREGKKPIDFGLMVREAPATLEYVPLITAMNKLKNSESYIRSVDIMRKTIDTSKIFKDLDRNQRNRIEVDKLLDKLTTHIKHSESTNQKGSKPYYAAVPREMICDFLNKLCISPANIIFDKKLLIDFISKNLQLDYWNVLLASGKKQYDVNKPWNLPKKVGFPAPFDDIVCVKRSFSFTPNFDNEDFFRVGGGKNTIVDPSIFSIPLTEKQRAKAKEAYKKENPDSKSSLSARYWLRESELPSLVIYAIDLKPTERSETKEEVFSKRKENALLDTIDGNPIYGFALGFPGKGSEILKVKYRINLVKKKELDNDTCSEDIDEDVAYDLDED